jgi:hypothetical protein
VILLVIGLVPVLAHRMALEPVPQQDALQVWVTIEADAKHVPHFALLKVGAGPDGGQARHVGIGPVGQADFEGDARSLLVRPGRVQVIDDLQAVGIVGGGQVRQIVKSQFVAEVGGDCRELAGVQDQPLAVACYHCPWKRFV